MVERVDAGRGSDWSGLLGGRRRGGSEQLSSQGIER